MEGDNHDDGALDGTFGDSIRISFLPENDYNNTIDFHALVVDVAGNIGFSDSDADGPRFINNLGEVDDQAQDWPIQRSWLVCTAHLLLGRDRPGHLPRAVSDRLLRRKRRWRSGSTGLASWSHSTVQLMRTRLASIHSA